MTGTGFRDLLAVATLGAAAAALAQQPAPFAKGDPAQGQALVDTGYFPEEEEHIAAWLNQRYYHFKP